MDAFRLLVEQYQGPLVGYLTRLVGCNEAAQDYAQEAFLRIFSKSQHYQEQGQFRAYLYRTALNLVRSSARKDKARAVVSHLVPIRPEGEEASQHRAVQRKELRREIRRVVATLPLRFRVPLVLYEVEEWSYADIASHLGCREGTVKSRIHRARGLVRQRLATDFAGFDFAGGQT